MSVFYKSISLNQIVYVDKINDLTQEQQLVLQDELKLAVEEMKFMEARVKSENTNPRNTTWLHKVNVKINICNQFLRIIELQKTESKTFKKLYENKLQELIQNKIGLKTYKIFEQKAHILTMSEIMKDQ
tara:strand:+ start:487 stop:873 length:387 start_codon:yes stop_codon:yes gene_type:complete